MIPVEYYLNGSIVQYVPWMVFIYHDKYLSFIQNHPYQAPDSSYSVFSAIADAITG